LEKFRAAEYGLWWLPDYHTKNIRPFLLLSYSHFTQASVNGVSKICALPRLVARLPCRKLRIEAIYPGGSLNRFKSRSDMGKPALAGKEKCPLVIQQKQNRLLTPVEILPLVKPAGWDNCFPASVSNCAFVTGALLHFGMNPHFVSRESVMSGHDFFNVNIIAENIIREDEPSRYSEGVAREGTTLP
jgi:hypothetical protein